MENCETIIEWLPDEPLDEETIDLAKQIEKDAGELIAAEGSVDYRHVRQNGKPIQPLLVELTLNAENAEQKKILINARVEFRKNVENIRNRYENHKNILIHKMKLIMENCDEVLEWLNDNPDKPLDEEIFNLAKQTEKDAEELIDSRVMLIQTKIHTLDSMNQQKKIFKDGKFHLRNNVETIRKRQ